MSIVDDVAEVTVELPPADQRERDRIRTALDETLFVQAGAGTGKTHALVTRVVQLVATGHLAAMQQLAAITFTENAAAELRNRIRSALHHAAHDPNTPTEAAHRLHRAVDEIDDAAISTLHGFAARILSDYPLEAGLSPGFTVADQLSGQVTFDESWRVFVDELLSNAEVAPHLTAALTLGLRMEALRAVAEAFSGSWDRLDVAHFSREPLPPLETGPIVHALERAVADLDQAPDDDALTLHLRTRVVPLIRALREVRADGPGGPNALLELLHTASPKCSQGAKSAWQGAGLSKAAVVTELRTAADLCALEVERTGVAACEALCDALQSHVLRWAEDRRARGRLEFHDLLVLTRDLLAGADGQRVRHQLHDRFAAILVDEFQDTDPLQIEIVARIAGLGSAADWRQISCTGGRLFFVGDPKQSIYRFRRADVGLYTEVGSLHAAGETPLRVNFRTVPGIIDAANVLFAELFTGPHAAAGQVPYAPLAPHRAANDCPRPVTLLGGPTALNAAALRSREAHHIARTIAAHVGEAAGPHPWRTRHGRAARYQDVAVLMPTRSSLSALETALQAEDIPYRVESRSLIWATDAVRDVVTILQAVDNPADEVATVAALRHHGLACSDADLGQWVEAGGTWSYLAPAPVGIGAEHPVAQGMRRLRMFHERRGQHAVNEVVDHVITSLRLVELTGELRRPRDHWRRLRFVVDQARAFCDAGGVGFGAFVAWATGQLESEADALETVVPEPDDDAVRILTIHGAKGLEFPVTIVTGLGGRPRSGDTVLWGDDRPEVRLKAGTLATAGYETEAARDKEASAAEAARLFYVATTRAEDHLVLSCYYKPTKSGARSHAQVAFEALAAHPAVVHEEAPADPGTPVGEGTEPRAEVPGEPVPEPAVEAAAETSREVIERGRDEVGTEHGRITAALRSRTATSPTALVQGAAAAHNADEPVRQDSEPVETEVAGFTVALGPPPRAEVSTGAAIGTALHLVMELVDLASWTDDEVERLATFACAEGGIPSMAPGVAARARYALRSPIIVEAAASGRFWREVYVITRDGERFVEGYVDMVVETREADLVVVDFKTDQVTDDSLGQKAQHYRPQLNAYAAALRAATGKDVRRGILLFATPVGAHEVEVPIEPPV